MAGKVIDVTLRLLDKMSSPLGLASSKLQENANQWTRAGKGIMKTGKTMENVGKAMTKTVTAPIAAAGIASVKLAAGFEKGMSDVKSISGETGKKATENFAKLADKAKEMGAKTKFSAKDSTEAYKYMAMAGWKAKDMLQGLSGTMYLAGSTGEGLGKVSDIVTDSLSAFKMRAKDTNKFVDILAKTASSANTDVGKMGESFKYVAPVAGTMGYSLKDTALTLGLMANQGIKASQAGTSLRSWMSRMANPTDAVEGAMKKLGLSLTDASGKMKPWKTILAETRKGFSGLTKEQKAQYASIIAGKNGMSGMLAVVDASEKDFNGLTKAIDNSNGAAKKMYEVANDNLAGQLTTLKSTIESIGIAFGKRMSPYVKEATKSLQGVSNWINNLNTKQQDAIIKIGLVAAAIGPALIAYGKMVKGVGKVTTSVGTLGKTLRRVKTFSAFVTLPAAQIVIGFVAIVAVTLLLIKHWKTVKKVAKTVFSYIKSVFSGVGLSGAKIKKELSPIGKEFSKIGKDAKKLSKTIGPPLKAIRKVVTTVFVGTFSIALGMVAGLLQSVWSTVVTVAGGITTAFGGLIKFITGVFTGNWRSAWNGVKQIFSGVFNSLVGLAKGPINAVIGIVNGAISRINSIHVSIPSWVPGVGGKTFAPHVGKIPALAKGTNNWGGGIAQISEKGGEIVDLPRGSRVYPHDASIKKAYQDGKRSTSANIVIKIADKIVVKEEADIDKIVQKIANKLEKIFYNTGGGEFEYIY